VIVAKPNIGAIVRSWQLSRASDLRDGATRRQLNDAETLIGRDGVILDCRISRSRPTMHG
jgi:hypothetical protein